MPTYTPRFSLAKPLVADAIDEDLWGGYLNDNFDIIDGAMNSYETATGLVSPYTVLTSDASKVLLIDATSGGFTVNLLAAATAGNGFRVTFKKVDSTVNTVTIDGSTTETIDGALTYVLGSQYQVVSLVSDGTNWRIDTGYLTLKTASSSSGTYTNTLSDRQKAILLDATTGAITANLVSAATAGSGYEVTFKKIDSSLNAVTLDASGSETIDGSLTYPLSLQNNGATLVSDGTNWFVKSTNSIAQSDKAYVNFSVSPGTCTIMGTAFNISSVTYVTLGKYTINFTVPMSDTNYGMVAGVVTRLQNDNNEVDALMVRSVGEKTVNSVTVIAKYNQGGGTSQSYDPAEVYVRIK